MHCELRAVNEGVLVKDLIDTCWAAPGYGQVQLAFPTISAGIRPSPPTLRRC